MAEDFYDQLQTEFIHNDAFKNDTQIFAGDRPLSLLEKSTNFYRTMNIDLSSIRQSLELLSKQRPEQSKLNQQTSENVSFHGEDHENTSHEELIEASILPQVPMATPPNAFSQRFTLSYVNQDRYDQIQYDQTPVFTKQELQDYKQNRTTDSMIRSQQEHFGDQTVSQITTSSIPNLQNWERHRLKIKRYHDKKDQMERELQKCLLNQQILTNKINKNQQMGSFDVHINNSKIDVGLAKCYLNKDMFQAALGSESIKQVEVFYEITVKTNENSPVKNLQYHSFSDQKFESEKILIASDRQTLLQWNQTFSVKLQTGLEKIILKLFIFSIALGKVEVDTLELQIEKLLPKLMDQKIKSMPFITESQYAFEILLKWRYDESQNKLLELQKRTTKIRKLLDKYKKKIEELKNAEQQQQSPENPDNVSQGHQSSFNQFLQLPPSSRSIVVVPSSSRSQLSNKGSQRRVLARKSDKSRSNYSSRSNARISSNLSEISPDVRFHGSQGSYGSNQEPAQSNTHMRMPSFSNVNDFVKEGRVHSRNGSIQIQVYDDLNQDNQFNKGKFNKSQIEVPNKTIPSLSSHNLQKTISHQNSSIMPDHINNEIKIGSFRERSVSEKRKTSDVEYVQERTSIQDKSINQSIQNKSVVQNQSMQEKSLNKIQLEKSLNLSQIEKSQHSTLQNQAFLSSNPFTEQNSQLRNEDVSKAIVNEDRSNEEKDKSPNQQDKFKKAFAMKFQQQKIKNLQKVIDRKFGDLQNKTFKIPSRNITQSNSIFNSPEKKDKMTQEELNYHKTQQMKAVLSKLNANEMPLNATIPKRTLAQDSNFIVPVPTTGSQEAHILRAIDKQKLARERKTKVEESPDKQRPSVKKVVVVKPRQSPNQMDTNFQKQINEAVIEQQRVETQESQYNTVTLSSPDSHANLSPEQLQNYKMRYQQSDYDKEELLSPEYFLPSSGSKYGGNKLTLTLERLEDPYSTIQPMQTEIRTDGGQLETQISQIKEPQREPLLRFGIYLEQTHQQNDKDGEETDSRQEFDEKGEVVQGKIGSSLGRLFKKLF